eukprot:360207-Chlamydomonas_euryale.AAC.18
MCYVIGRDRSHTARHSQEASAHLAGALADELMKLDLDEALPLTRACGHYLNLTGMAELQHRCVRCCSTGVYAAAATTPLGRGVQGSGARR